MIQKKIGILIRESIRICSVVDGLVVEDYWHTDHNGHLSVIDGGYAFLSGQHFQPLETHLQLAFAFAARTNGDPGHLSTDGGGRITAPRDLENKAS